MNDAIARFVKPDRIHSRAEVLASPCPVPAEGGVYGWWFRTVPAEVDTSLCVTREGLTLLYVGISPTAPPSNGCTPSRESLRSRLRTHYTGNAEGSTLRKTLGCLLADELGIELRRVGSGTRMTFLHGEPVLSEWMARNALVSWVTHARPWEFEDELIATLDLPLNLRDNGRHPFHPELSRIRSAAVRRAKELPVVANPGIAGRFKEEPMGSTGRFAARVVADGPPGRAALGRLVLTEAAAMVDRRSVDDARRMLGAAVEALMADGVSLDILVTPAGFVDHKPGGSWSGPTGWDSMQSDFDHLAAMAASVAADLVTPELRERARGVVDHLVIGIDVWPTDGQEPHAEVACLYHIAAGTVRPVTGKTYPTTPQEDDLIREPDAASHVVQVGEERLAVLVCHDLAAWSPRGNAVAKGPRAEVWSQLQAAVTAARPTLAVQMPHTVDNARTWTAAWAMFGRVAGADLRAATIAIRHLDKGYGPVAGPFDGSLLTGTGWGERVVDVVIGASVPATTVSMPPARLATEPGPAARSVATRTTAVPRDASDRGIGLARVAMEVFRPRSAAYPDGIRVPDLMREVTAAGCPIAGDDPVITLRSALNGSQAHGVWLRRDGGLWVPGSGHSKMEGGLSGRPLAEALHEFVRGRYPGGVFHYEEARVGLERTGVAVKGTGATTRGALADARDLFEHIAGREGMWRWK